MCKACEMCVGCFLQEFHPSRTLFTTQVDRHLTKQVRFSWVHPVCLSDISGLVLFEVPDLKLSTLGAMHWMGQPVNVDYGLLYYAHAGYEQIRI